MLRLLCRMVVCCGLTVGIAHADEPPKSSAAVSATDLQPTDETVRAAVTRSLPYLETAGVAWVNEMHCNSCHHVPFMLWSHRAAQARGLTIDVKKLAEWDEFARNDSLAHRHAMKLTQEAVDKLDPAMLPVAVKEKLKPIVNHGLPAEAEFIAMAKSLLTPEEWTMHQALLVKTATVPITAFDRNGGGPDTLGTILIGERAAKTDPASSEFRAGIIDLLKRQQLPDGNWTPGNQQAMMRRWPRPAADQTTTMWTALGLAGYEVAGEKRSEQIERAIAYERQQPPQPDHQEWLATRLLFEHQLGSAEEVAKLRQQAIAGRNTNCGWSWAKGGESDPYTTGLMVYVLSKVGGLDDPAVIRDARKYLLNCQQADGSWLTPSKNITKTEVPERLKARDEIYHYWGTAWAVIGLLETLPASP